jgi:hypothetical protein
MSPIPRPRNEGREGIDLAGGRRPRERADAHMLAG